MTRTRIEWIDLVKGMAIILIILAHCFEYFSVNLGVKSFLLPIIYSFHVPLFFIASGFLFKVKGASFLQFIKKKLKTIILPYCTFALFIIAFDAVKIYLLHTKDDISVIGDIKGMLVQNHFNSLWFLACLFIIQLISFFAVRLKEKGLSILICVLFAAALAYQLFINKKLPWCLDTVIFTLPFFLTGYLLKQNGLYERIFKLKNLALFIPIGLLATYLNYTFTDIRYVNIFHARYGILPLFYIAAFCNSFAIITIAKQISFIKCINYFGKYSLVYYALHNLVLIFIFHFLFGLYKENMLYYIIFCVITTILILIVMTVVNTVFIKTPLCVLIGKNYHPVKKEE